MGRFAVYTNVDRWQEYLIGMAPEDEKGIRMNVPSNENGGKA